MVGLSPKARGMHEEVDLLCIPLGRKQQLFGACPSPCGGKCVSSRASLGSRIASFLEEGPFGSSIASSTPPGHENRDQGCVVGGKIVNDRRGFGWLHRVGVIWTAHIAMDRLFGYGLKLESGFRDTHLAEMGRR